MWCHFGGRVQFGETIEAALRRHASENFTGVLIEIDRNPQPTCVFPWFPDHAAPSDGTAFGRDPRKHAIGLGFVLSCTGEPTAIGGGESKTIDFFAKSDLPNGMWPGADKFLAGLLAGY